MKAKQTDLRTAKGEAIYDLDEQAGDLWAVAGPPGYDPAAIDPDALPEGFRWINGWEWEQAQRPCPYAFDRNGPPVWVGDEQSEGYLVAFDPHNEDWVIVDYFLNEFSRAAKLAVVAVREKEETLCDWIQAASLAESLPDGAEFCVFILDSMELDQLLAIEDGLQVAIETDDARIIFREE